jgi:hypothetical protein
MRTNANHASRIVVLALAACPAAAQGQVWIRQFGTSSVDGLGAAAPDGAGGTYVGGLTRGNLGGPNAGDYDAWVARYDSAGSQLWVRQLGTTTDNLVNAAASGGSVGGYFGGSTEGALTGTSAGYQDAWFALYDGAGNQMWVRQLGSGGVDHTYAAAPDSANGVFVGGDTQGMMGGPLVGAFDGWIARYDSAGNQMWIQQVGTTVSEAITGAAVDGAGGVFFTGYTAGSLGGSNVGGADAWLARYDSGGTQLWQRQLGTPVEDRALAAASDGSGGVYIGGWTQGSFGGPSAGVADAWIAHYDGAGTQAWIRQLGTSVGDEIRAMAFQGTSGVYVGGLTSGSLGGTNAGSSDAWLARYSHAGTQVWIRQMGTTGADWIYGAATFASGGVYAGGWTQGSLGGPSLGLQDAWLGLYDAVAGSSYCTAGTSTNGCVPAISGVGAPSATAVNGFTVGVSGVEGQKSGIVFYGINNSGWTPLPWASGSSSFLCVKPPTQRTPAQNSGGTAGQCNGNLALDWNAFRAANPTALGSPFAAGQHIYAQGWYRDPPAPKTTSLSNALDFTLLP